LKDPPEKTTVLMNGYLSIFFSDLEKSNVNEQKNDKKNILIFI